MRDIFKILQKLHDKKIYFCFQSLSSAGCINLAVVDVHGKTHYLVDDDLPEIEKRLKVIWGHLLDTPMLKSMPLPPSV